MAHIFNIFPVGFHILRYSKTGTKDYFFPKPLVSHAGFNSTFIHWGSNIHSYLEEKLYDLSAFKQNTKESLITKNFIKVRFSAF